MTSGTDEQRIVLAPNMSPGGRLIRVAMAAATVSVAVHVAIALLDRPVGEKLFPGPFGGFEFAGFGVLVGLVAVGILMALHRVPVVDILVCWPIGCTLAVMYWLLAWKPCRWLSETSGPATSPRSRSSQSTPLGRRSGSSWPPSQQKAGSPCASGWGFPSWP
jgi:hypothetical protein